jgi:hypothetical protein
MESSRQTIGKWYGCFSVEYAPWKSLLGASAAGPVLAACMRPASGGELGAIPDRLSPNILRESPESATSLAVSEEQAGGRYIDRLSDASREGLRRQLTVLFCDLVDSTAPAFTTSKGEA